MAEVARQSGLGSATLYRNFATRQALLEALLFDELDEVCAAAATTEGSTSSDRLKNWLRRFFRYVTTERPAALDLLVLEGIDTSKLKLDTRKRLIAAGQPLLTAAQDAHEIDRDLDLEQIIDLVMAIAKITGAPRYRQPILEVALTGLHPTR